MGADADSEDLEFARARATLLRALASYFLCAPDPNGPLPLGDATADNELLRAFSDEEFARALRELRGGPPPDPLMLRDEYHALFVVPGPSYLAPFASAHMHESRPEAPPRRRGTLVGPGSLSVRRFYERAGFAMEGMGELPDHVGVELTFLSALCESECLAWTEGRPDDAEHFRRLQSEFLTQFLAPFALKLCARIDEARPSPTYRCVAALLRAAVLSDALRVAPVAQP